MVGKGPRPRTPFSDCKWTTMPGAMKFDASIGIPIPWGIVIEMVQSQIYIVNNAANKGLRSGGAVWDR